MGSQPVFHSRTKWEAWVVFSMHHPICPLLSCLLLVGSHILGDKIKTIGKTPIAVQCNASGREMDRHERPRQHEPNAARRVPYVRRPLRRLQGISLIQALRPVGLSKSCSGLSLCGFERRMLSTAPLKIQMVRLFALGAPSALSGKRLLSSAANADTTCTCLELGSQARSQPLVAKQAFERET